jgi:UDP-N-acetylmuramate--alanine ligase
MKFSQFSSLKRIHFIGIGGIGMSGIAQVLFHNGYTVSGSDISSNNITKNLNAIGIHVYSRHEISNIDDVDVVVISSAISDDNIELVAAHEKKIPVLSRAEMLGELMRFKFGIAVSGTHGKTTTTSLIAHIFKVANLDPTYVIGGIVNSTEKNADIGRGDYLVTEADESDASFVALSPMISVVTNIDDDHMSTYGNNNSDQDKSFLEFIHRVPFYGKAILCGDDDRVKSLFPMISRQFQTYGFNESNDYRAVSISQVGLTTSFCLERQDMPPINIKLNLPGVHNILNSLAAIAVATSCRISDVDICKALSSFEGISRRFQLLGDFNVCGKKFTLIDDYGHHPVELDATLKTAREAFPGKKITMIFQPHRFTRTQSLWNDFITVLAKVDKLILLPIYTGGEDGINGITADTLADAVREKVNIPVCVSSISSIYDNLGVMLGDSDIVLCQGAGSVSKICRDAFCSKEKSLEI